MNNKHTTRNCKTCRKSVHILVQTCHHLAVSGYVRMANLLQVVNSLLQVDCQHLLSTGLLKVVKNDKLFSTYEL